MKPGKIKFKTFFFIGIIILVSCAVKRQEFYNNEKTIIKRIYKENFFTKKYEGKYINFRPNGDTMLIDHYRNGKLHGLSAFFYEGGKKETISYYSNDLLNGEYLEFYFNGIIRKKVTYKYDRLWAIDAVNDSNGNALNYGHLIMGNGRVRTFYLDNTVEYEGEYKNGVKHGWWHFYTNTGLLYDSTYYNYGKKEGSDDIHFFY